MVEAGSLTVQEVKLVREAFSISPSVSDANLAGFLQKNYKDGKTYFDAIRAPLALYQFGQAFPTSAPLSTQLKRTLLDDLTDWVIGLHLDLLPKGGPYGDIAYATLENVRAILQAASGIREIMRAEENEVASYYTDQLISTCGARCTEKQSLASWNTTLSDLSGLPVVENMKKGNRDLQRVYSYSQLVYQGRRMFQYREARKEMSDFLNGQLMTRVSKQPTIVCGSLPTSFQRVKATVTIFGRVFFVAKQGDGQFYIEPVVYHGQQGYESLYVSSHEIEQEQVTVIQRRVKEARTFWLYLKGVGIGVFEVKGIRDLSGSNGPRLALMGDVKWYRKPPELLGALSQAAQGLPMLLPAVALSQLVPQPCWREASALSPEQAESFAKIVRANLMEASARLTEELRKRGSGGSATQRIVGTAPKNRVITVVDLNRDGQPLVYGSVRWAGHPCNEVFASVLASWQSKWVVLRASTSMAECGEFGEWAGDSHFNVESIVDIDGDGVAEILISQGRLEAWTLGLYQLRNGELIKVLDLGMFGS